MAEFANWNGYLLAPNSSAPDDPVEQSFYIQDLERPSLAYLDGSRQLIAEVAESETAFRSGKPVGARYRRTVGSIARLIAGTQVGLALGGGAAWGWAHIGVLAALEANGIPVDMIAGCSMGSVIGGLRSAGLSIADLEEIAGYWRNRKARFVEWRLWRFCLLNERVVNKVFRGYFGNRQVNQTEVPYWANAVDIRAGREFTLREGSLVDCVRASIALPGLLPPLDHGKELLLDASVSDPVPVRLVRKMGARFIVAVNAMVPPEAQKMTLRYPFNLLEILHRCMFVMGHEIGQAGAERSADVVFTPDLTHINMLQFGRSPEIIQSGRLAAEQRMPAIQAMYARRKAQVCGEDAATASLSFGY
ncbi:MAG: patatin-like phospholipase family protein [Acidobacteria bacterium]|nr:patatin-like phospholipase family protein [Acidobacteriota bacterium]